MSKLYRKFMRWSMAVGLAAVNLQVMATGPQRSVVELFTSQGCSSCPPADAIVGRLSADPHVLVLSYHVTYWDDLGWKDSFSSSASTDRQYAYARALGERSVFTPQLVVNGTQSVVGSQENAVRSAVVAAGQRAFPIQASLAKQADGSYEVAFTGPTLPGDVWEVRYVRHSVTSIRAGENRGRSIETFNNVTRIQRLGPFRAGTLKIQALKQPEDGLAVFVQSPNAGPILGAVAL